MSGRTVGQALAAVCSVLFVISSVAVLVLFNIERKAFSSDTYKQAFADLKLYERMPVILGTALQAYFAEQGSTVPFLQALTIEDWQNSITLLLPPEELKTMANGALDATSDYLNGKVNSAVLSLLPVKTQLAGDPGMRVAVEILRRQPPCTPEQLAQMALGLLGGQIALCSPPEQAIGLLTPLIQSQLQAMTAVIPDQVAFIPAVASGTATDPRGRLNAVRSGVKLLAFVPIGFLFGLTIFAVRKLLDLLAWWGWPLLFAGGTSVLIGLFGSPLVGGVLQLLIQTQGARFIPSSLASSIAETGRAVARQMLGPVVIEGFILGFVGLCMVIAATILARGGRLKMDSIE